MWYIRLMADNDNTNKWRWVLIMPMYAAKAILFRE